ncbi:ATP-binding protein [Solwaraspora sp. WMMD406]|uniref:ATP-binding protein n=1 Tax=Solwaraspora sp. WMMD406 TaxID=3016095 RepID=UPI002416E8F1|nr:ATP-binding protein [Solwaraspora sp. WMMD406]MDG4763224.1 ATP-binding protein [Solwaraspora sp. WMMD406]
MADRLRTARDGAFVGRTAEVAAFRATLAGAPGTRPVWYLHGPGGIGKSMLLRRFAVEARDAGRIVVQADGAGIEPSPDGFTAAAYAATSGAPAVLLVDTFERCQGLESWLRDRFLPQISDGVVVVIASRRPPDREWEADLGWSDVLRVVALGDLPPDAAMELLDRRGVASELWDAVLRFAGGHPLALNLSAAVANSDHDADTTWAPTPDVVATLLHQLVGEVPSPQHRLALETCSHALTTTEDLLRAVVGEPAAELFAWLRRLPFVESDQDGIVPHDVVRSVLDADLRWRDPRGYRVMHTRVAAHLLHRARAASGDAALPAVRSLYHILQDSAVMAPFALRHGGGAVYPDQARPADHATLRQLARQADGADDLVGFWLERQPEAFDVYRRSRDGAIDGFQVTLRLPSPAPEELAADPVVAAVWAHAASAPPRPGEHILLTRFGYPLPDQRRSAIRDLMNIRTLQWWIRSERLAWSFLTLADEAVGVAEFIDHLPIHPRPIVDGRPYDLYAHDWRAVPLDMWAQRVTAWPLAGLATVPETVTAELTVLSRPQFDAAVRSAVKHFHDLPQLRTNPLARSRMVAEHESGRDGDPESARDDDPAVTLRGLLTEATELLRADPRDAKLHQVLVTTYLSGRITQEAAAQRLGLPASTYKRHLRGALHRLCESLWRRESR